MGQRALAALIVMLCLAAAGLALWSGCDFNKVDEPADGSVEAVVTDLDAADTPDQALQALQALEEHIYFEGSTYELYRLSDEQLERLSEAQATFVQGNDTELHTVEDLIQYVIGETGLTMQAEELLATFNEQARAAAKSQSAEQAVLLAAMGSERWHTNRTLHSKTVLSPTQQVYFAIWLHQHTGWDKRFERCVRRCQRLGFVCRLLCFVFGGGSECFAACEDFVTECINACHDQGGGGS